MSYISALIALFMTPSKLNGPLWWDLYLDNLVAVETFFYQWVWCIWGVLIVIGIALAVYFAKRFGPEAFAGMSCVVIIGGIVLLLLPLLEYITMNLSIRMADSVGPAGIVNEGQLVLSALLYLLLGVG